MSGNVDADGAGTGRGGRSRGSALDLVRSTTVIVVLVAAVVLLFPRPDRTPAATVDVAQVAASVSGRAGFSVAVPRGLPPGWTATGAGLFEGSDGTPTWRVTYRTPDGDPVGFVQGLRPSRVWEGRMVIDGRESAERIIDGNRWIDRSRTDRGITNLVHRGGDLTTIVTGRTDPATLEVLLRGLGLSG
ncbi:MAG: DUF4245 domain-containing protein [Actinomycetales bacterium]|nr:DUF4245 domain-containing protein [Actinomycetales bacterium]